MASRSPSKAGNFDFSNFGENDTIVHDVFDKENDNTVVENESPRGGKYNLRPNPTPTLLMHTDTSQKK